MEERMAEGASDERNLQPSKESVTEHASNAPPGNAVASLSGVLGWVSLAFLALLYAAGRSVAAELSILLAVTALLCAISAIVLGHTGRRRASTMSGRGKRITLHGLILGYAVLVVLLYNLMFPTLSGACREAGKRVRCGLNLYQIDRAMTSYAQANNGKYPPKLAQLLADGTLSPDVFVCPSTDDRRARGATVQAQLADFEQPGRCSYVYLGAGLTTSAPADVILAYEDLQNHEGNGAHVLFSDGRVEWFGKSQAQEIIQELKAGKNPPPSLKGLP